MAPVIVPEEYNYVAAFLTLRCALGCSYCINTKSDGVVRKREEMSAEEWVRGINNLEIKPGLAVTLEGGEPTMHPEFYGIVQGINHPIDLLTNLQFNVEEFIHRVDPKKFNGRTTPGYKSIRASYHSERMGLGDTIQRAVRLQDAGFPIGLFSLNLPEATAENMQMAEAARQNRMYFFIKDFLGMRGDRLFGHFKYPEGLDGKAKECECRTTELLISPAGEVYRCHRDLYRKENPVAHLLDPSLKLEDKFRFCNRFGECNPCDLKLKTNRFLQMGSCAVEIRPVEKT